MKAKRQAKTITIDGIIYSVCHDCGQPVKYPDGINMRRGGELHKACWQARYHGQVVKG